MTAWIFQGNPDRYDVDGYLADERDINWAASQHRDRISIGDPVFLWRTGADAGVVGQAVVSTAAHLAAEDPAGLRYQRDAEADVGPDWRVRLRVHHVANKKQVVKRDWLKGDPVCHDLPNIRFSNATNYPLGDRHFHRLAALCARTGRPFDAYELWACLLAYAETFGGPVSELPGSPVAAAAVEIGRAVSCVYAKVMNFRSLDPRRSGGGQPHGNADDAVVWDRYWTGAGVDVDRLTGDLGRGSDAAAAAGTDVEQPGFAGDTEGRRQLQIHWRLERKPGLVRRAKAVWRSSDPLLRCEVCRRSFAEDYGELGDGFIEAHHRTPLAALESPVETRLQVLAPVCANCHRMLHRRGTLDVDALRAALNDRHRAAE